MHVRVRRLFLEETASTSTDFVDDALITGLSASIPDEIDQGYDQGCHRQQADVTRNAEMSGRLEEHDHPFLAQYLSHSPLTIVSGTRDYAMPGDMYRRLWVTIGGLRGIFVQPGMDRLIQTYPSQYGPAKGEFFWTVLAKGVASPPVAGDATRVLRIYVYGNTTVPMSPTTGEFVYYRAVQPIAYQSPAVTWTDCLDPYNEGPTRWACADLLDKAQEIEKADAMRAKAIHAWNSIIPPPQATA